MKRSHQIVTLVAGIAVLSLIGFLYSGLQHNPKDIPSTMIGKPAPDFRAAWLQARNELPSSAERHFSLADLKGKHVILNFWASWCFSCRDEAKDLQAFWEMSKAQNIYVIGIAIQDTPEAALEFAGTYGKRYVLGLDEDGKASIDYGVTGVPETFFINADGIIVHKHIGPVSTAQLTEASAKYFAAK